jgi:carbon-monoxide dehydrogenase large subunit
MLHLAMVRSPFAHATITGIDTSAAAQAPTSSPCTPRADFPEGQGVCINAWPITPDQVTPTTCPWSVERVACAGEIVAVVVARSAAAAARRRELVDVDFAELPAVLDAQGGAEGRGARPPEQGHEQVRLLAARLGRAGHRRRRRRGHRGGPRRRHRHRARVPPAAAHPGLHGAPLHRRRPDRRAGDDVDGDAGPAHPALPHRRDDGYAGEQDPRHRPRCGRWLRRQAADHPRGVRHPRRGPQARQAVQVHRDPLGVAALGHHGRDQYQKLTLSATKDGTVTGLKVELRRQPRCLRRHRRRRGAGARRVDVQRDLQVPGLPVQLPDGAHEQDLGRRLPRRRAPRGDLRHRAAHGRARRRGRGRPDRDPREELDQARRVPVHLGGGHDLRLGQLRGRHRAGQGALRLRRAARRAEGPRRVRRPGPARHRRLDLHRDVRSGALAGARLAQLRRRRLGERSASGCSHRQGRGRHRASPHGQGHETAWSQIVADRLGVPFEDVEVLHGDTQIAYKGLDTYGSRSLVVGG